MARFLLIPIWPGPDYSKRSRYGDPLAGFPANPSRLQTCHHSNKPANLFDKASGLFDFLPASVIFHLRLYFPLIFPAPEGWKNRLLKPFSNFPWPDRAALFGRKDRLPAKVVPFFGGNDWENPGSACKKLRNPNPPAIVKDG